MIKWFRALIGSGEHASTNMDDEAGEQAVLIHVHAEDVQSDYPVSDLATLEDDLQEIIGDLGEVDGHDIGSDDATVYVYGRSAEEIFAAIRSHLISGELTGRAKVTLRYGPPDSSERVVQLPHDR